MISSINPMGRLNTSAHFLLAIGFFIACASCVTRENWEQEATILIQKGTQLQHEHEQLDASIDSLWNVTTEQLAKSLPPDFPPIDRDIFLNARNADHIRMFMSFNELDPTIQSIVDQAGMYDQLLAEKIRKLSEDQLRFELEKNQFLRKVEQQNASAGKIYADKLRLNIDNKSL